MLTDEQLADLATVHLAPQFNASDTLDLLPLLRAVETLAIEEEREACNDAVSDKLEIAQKVAQALSDDGFYGGYTLGLDLWHEFAAAYNVAP